MSITLEDLTRDRVVTSLYSRVCPACNDRKGEEKSLCYSCFCALPKPLKDSLYDRVGCGYEEALLASLKHLNAERFYMPMPAAEADLG